MAGAFDCMLGCEGGEPRRDYSADHAVGAGLLIGGVVGLAGLPIWELVDVSQSVDRYNQNIREGLKAISVAPLILPTQKDARSPATELAMGLRLSAVF